MTVKDDEIVAYWKNQNHPTLRGVAGVFGVSHEHVRNVLDRKGIDHKRAESTRDLNINFRPPTREWYNRLQQYADQADMSRRQVLIHAVEEYLARRGMEIPAELTSGGE